MDIDYSVHHNLQSPPPYLAKRDGNSFTISVSTSTQKAPQYPSQLISITTYTFNEAEDNRAVYRAIVPKKREGWKAQIDYISEKSRYERRYEVRREPLARRYDLRDAQGNHNVLIPTSSINQKSFSLEASDGQKLLWRKINIGWELLSLPSQTVLAKYTITCSSPKPIQSSAMCIPLGKLEITTLPSEVKNDSILTAINPNTLRRTDSESSSSSSEGPRLGSIYKRLAVGLCAPAAIVASIASPYAAAGMNRHCVIGDELSNLGRVNINASLTPSYTHQPSSSSSDWLQMNQPSSTRKSNDPRPRRVDLDLIISSFVAMLAG